MIFLNQRFLVHLLFQTNFLGSIGVCAVLWNDVMKYQTFVLTCVKLILDRPPTNVHHDTLNELGIQRGVTYAYFILFRSLITLLQV